MDELQLQQLLTFDSYTKPVFRGVFPKNRLPWRTSSSHFRSAYVINLDDSHLPGSHWVAMYLDLKHGGEYFDSYGQPPIEECQRLLDLCPQTTYNTTILQEDTLVCGQYCVIYLMLRCRGFTLESIVDHLQVPWNDGLVHSIVNTYFPHMPFRF